MKSGQAIWMEGRKIGNKNAFQTGAGENGMLYRCDAFYTSLDFFLTYSTQTYLENAETFLLPKRYLSIILAE